MILDKNISLTWQNCPSWHGHIPYEMATVTKMTATGISKIIIISILHFYEMKSLQVYIRYKTCIYIKDLDLYKVPKMIVFGILPALVPARLCWAGVRNFDTCYHGQKTKENKN